MVGIEEYLPVIPVALVVALVPALALAILLMRDRGVLWKAFFLGWAGWLLALAVRIIPVQLPQQFLAPQIQSDLAILLLVAVYASALAGIFEEGLRYFILKKRVYLRADRSSILSFGLGWGIGEAIIIFVPALVSSQLLSYDAPSLLELLPGALERNLAIVAHLSFTLIVLAGIDRGRRFLLLAMFLHFLINIMGVSAINITQDPWFSELVIAAAVALSITVAYYVNKPVRASNPSNTK